MNEMELSLRAEVRPKAILLREKIVDLLE